MSYYFAKTVDMPFDEAVERATAVLQENGFGVLTTIDVSSTLKKKLDVDMPRYVILGACNPGYANKALQAEPHIGVMLPCNVIVRETNGGVEVAAIDPIASMQAIRNESLGEIAQTVQGLMKKVIDDL